MTPVDPHEVNELDGGVRAVLREKVYGVIPLLTKGRNVVHDMRHNDERHNPQEARKASCNRGSARVMLGGANREAHLRLHHRSCGYVRLRHRLGRFQANHSRTLGCRGIKYGVASGNIPEEAK